MLARCYSDSGGYSDCTVCTEWLTFQNFAEWYHTQLNANKPDFHLDKDGLVKDNKLYSPETCQIISRDENLRLPRRQR